MALGTMAPAASRTVPEMLADSVCADTNGLQITNNASRREISSRYKGTSLTPEYKDQE